MTRFRDHQGAGLVFGASDSAKALSHSTNPSVIGARRIYATA
jgi:hypothetical protein